MVVRSDIICGAFEGNKTAELKLYQVSAVNEIQQFDRNNVIGYVAQHWRLVLY